MKCQKLVLLAGTILFALSGISSAIDIVFEDSNLEAAIRAELNILSGSISDTDMQALTELAIYNQAVSSLEGLQYANNLDKLNLSSASCSDLTIIGNLTSLTQLRLVNNQISDISPLASLTDLTVLDIAFNNISDLSPLSGLVNLTELVAYNNNISSLSSLTSLTSLVVLEVQDNSIEFIGNISGLLSLRAIRLDDNGIQSLVGAIFPDGIQYVYLFDNEIDDVNINWPDSISTLSLGNNNISDISGVVWPQSLKSLSLETNSISAVPVFNNAAGLNSLILQDNPLMSLDGLSGLSNLTTLWLSGVNLGYISDLSPIWQTGSVKDLKLAYSYGISDADLIFIISNLGVLNHLDLTGDICANIDSSTKAQLKQWDDIADNVLDYYVYGDADKDGDVDIFDFLVLKSNYGVYPCIWESGDFDNDLDVDIYDFLLLKENFGFVW